MENAGRGQSAAGASRKVQRYKAKDLYEPNDVFRELGLPIIDWGDNQWDPKSNNGKFLWGFAVEDPSDSPTSQPDSSIHWI
jgi:hypothetical protein